MGIADESSPAIYSYCGKQKTGCSGRASRFYYQRKTMLRRCRMRCSGFLDALGEVMQATCQVIDKVVHGAFVFGFKLMKHVAAVENAVGALDLIVPQEGDQNSANGNMLACGFQFAKLA